MLLITITTPRFNRYCYSIFWKQSTIPGSYWVVVTTSCMIIKIWRLNGRNPNDLFLMCFLSLDRLPLFISETHLFHLLSDMLLITAQITLVNLIISETHVFNPLSDCTMCFSSPHAQTGFRPLFEWAKNLENQQQSSTGSSIPASNTAVPVLTLSITVRTMLQVIRPLLPALLI